MAKIVHCRDLGFDCDGVVKADTEDAALQLVAEHAKTVHGMETIPPEVVQKAKTVMQDEVAGA
jgi:predicted small metal-binding protein